MNWLRNLLPNSAIDERRFRPNLSIDTSEKGLVEQNWIGKTLSIGDRLQIEITDLTQRCIMVNMAQKELNCDRHILQKISKKSQNNFGVYARVIQSGIVRIGDTVSCL